MIGFRIRTFDGRTTDFPLDPDRASARSAAHEAASAAGKAAEFCDMFRVEDDGTETHLATFRGWE